MSEDKSRVRKDRAAENIAVLRRIALSLFGQEKTLERGIQGKQLKVAVNLAYILLTFQRLTQDLPAIFLNVDRLLRFIVKLFPKLTWKICLSILC